MHWSSGLTKWGYTPPKETTETFKDWGAEDFIPQAIKGLYHRQLAAPKKEDDEQMENIKKESSKENVKKEASKKKEKTQQGKEEHTKKKSSKKRKLQEISDQEESGSSSSSSSSEEETKKKKKRTKIKKASVITIPAHLGELSLQMRTMRKNLVYQKNHPKNLKENRGKMNQQSP